MKKEEANRGEAARKEAEKKEVEKEEEEKKKAESNEAENKEAKTQQGQKMEAEKTGEAQSKVTNPKDWVRKYKEGKKNKKEEPHIDGFEKVSGSVTNKKSDHSAVGKEEQIKEPGSNPLKEEQNVPVKIEPGKTGKEDNEGKQEEESDSSNIDLDKTEAGKEEGVKREKETATEQKTTGNRVKNHQSENQQNDPGRQFQRALSAEGSFFDGILKEADALLQSSDNAKLSTLCKEIFGETSHSKMFSNLVGNQRKFCLMVLGQLFPKLLPKIETNFKINLESFTSTNAVLHYFDALIKSGVTENVDRGVVFVVGNTKVGKTSFVNTLSKFLGDPEKEPEPVLADDKNALLETKVLEYYDQIKFQHKKKLSLCLSTDKNKVGLINFKEDDMMEEENKEATPLNIKLVDMGGHQEYYASSTLFISTSGVFLICFDSHLLGLANEKNRVQDFYYGSVGTYIDLICHTTARARLRPKIALVATKVELLPNKDELVESILDLTKEHLSSISSDNQVFLVNKVLKTSSAKVTREDLTDFQLKLATLCSSEVLKGESDEARPESWQMLLTFLHEHSTCTLDEVIQKWKELKDSFDIPGEQKSPINISETDLDMLTKFKALLEAKSETLENAEIPHHPVPAHYSVPIPMPDSVPSTSLDKPESQEHEPVTPQATPFTAGATSVLEPLSGEEINLMPLTEQESTVESSGEPMKKEVSTILSYLTEIGEILWFKQKPELVICKPMDFIQSLRNIITHNLAKSCSGVKFLQTKSDLETKGVLSFEDFKAIYASNDFPAKEMWDLIVQLGLGFLLKEEVMIIPSLVSDNKGEMIANEEKEFGNCDETLCLNYHLDRNESTVNVYFELLNVLAKCFFWDNRGGDLRFTFGQKVENKRLGLVNGASGNLRWLTTDVKRSEVFDFLILEHEANENNISAPFATTKEIRIHLRPRKKKTKHVFEIFQKLDNKFTEAFPMDQAQRSLSCKKCQKEGQNGIFFLDPSLKVKSNARFCCSGHSIPDDIEWMMEMSGKAKTPFKLKNLMKQDKEKLGLEPFGESKIKEEMESGTLKQGAQIWIYHDKHTDRWNPIARWNPYSHCVVYVGETNKVHEVVHVYKAWSRVFRLGLIKGTIKRMDVNEAIKPNQLVFLGHKIEGCQFAGNVLEKIAERAKKCVDPEQPKIVFDYDHR